MFNFSALDQKNPKSNEGGREKDHLRKKPFTFSLEKLMRATK